MQITTKDTTAPVSTTVTTQPTQDARRLAAIAKIEGGRTTPANIAQDGSGHVAEATPSPTPTPGTAEAPEASSTKVDTAHIKQLADREKAAWAQIKQLKAEKAALEADKSKAVEGRLTKEEAVKLLRQDPTKLGLTYEELGQMFLQGNQPVDPMVAKLQAEIEELKGTVEKTTTAQQEQAKQAYEQALRQIETEAKALVASNDAYEITRSQGAESAITKLIETTYQEDGVLMNVEEAAAQVEAYLEAEAIALFNKSAKLKGKLVPAETNTTPVQGDAQKQATQMQTHTLTAAMSQASTKPLNARERAIAAFNKHSR
jgi:tetratricopeptide (TPR) repeat protein